jgi:hypothetical protein
MQAHGFVRNLRTLLIGVSPVVVAACGGTTISVGGGSSSGSTSTTLAGTFFGYTGTSRRSIPAIPPSTAIEENPIFGVVASDGSGFFADTQTAGHQAIFSMGTASSTGSSAISGFFNAYAANGSNLGDGTTIAASPDGGLTGTLSSTTTGTQAALNYAFPDGYSNAANIILDTPALAQSTIATATYSASNGSTGTATVATTAISTNANDTYTVNFNSATSFTVSTAGGCNFSGSVSPDTTLDIYHLSAFGTCPGTITLNLTGLASLLPANGHSPLGGTLAKNTLVLELDDSESGNAPKYAFALVAAQQ